MVRVMVRKKMRVPMVIYEKGMAMIRLGKRLSKTKKKRQKEKPLNLHLFDFKSLLSQMDMDVIRSSLGLPRHMELVLLAEDQRSYGPSFGYFIVFFDYLPPGCTVPPHRMLLRICDVMDFAAIRRRIEARAANNKRVSGGSTSRSEELERA
ncbi:hypothetical protein ABFS82_05G074600 [Erythranthe guttata]